MKACRHNTLHFSVFKTYGKVFILQSSSEYIYLLNTEII